MGWVVGWVAQSGEGAGLPVRKVALVALGALARFVREAQLVLVPPPRLAWFPPPRRVALLRVRAVRRVALLAAALAALLARLAQRAQQLGRRVAPVG